VVPTYAYAAADCELLPPEPEDAEPEPDPAEPEPEPADPPEFEVEPPELPELDPPGDVVPFAGPDEGVLVEELLEVPPQATIVMTINAAQTERRIRTFMASL